MLHFGFLIFATLNFPDFLFKIAQTFPDCPDFFFPLFLFIHLMDFSEFAPTWSDIVQE